MKKLTIIGSAIVLAGSSALAIAQQRGGGNGDGAGGRGGFDGGMTFEDLNTDTTVMRVGEGDNAAEMQVITRAEFDAFFADRGNGGRGGFDPTAMFDQWDANSDTYITEEEFNNRPQGRRGGGGRGPGAEGGDSEE